MDEGSVRRDRKLRKNIAGGLRLAWSASPSGFAFTVSMSFLSAVIPPVVVWLGKDLVDAMVSRRAASELLPTVVALGMLAAGQRTLDAFRSNRQDLYASRVGIHAEKTFLAQASRIDLGHFDNAKFHDLVARATRDVDWRPYNLTWSVIGLGGSAVTVIGMLGLLASLHPLLVVLSALSVLPVVVIQRRINRRLYEFWYTFTPEGREKDYMRQLLSETRWTKEVRAFGLGPHFRGRHSSIAEDQIAKLARLYRLADRYALTSGLVSGLALAAAYGFVASRGASGALSPGALTAVIVAFSSVTAQVNLISGSLLQIDQHAQFLADYFSFMAVRPLLVVQESPAQLPVRLDAGIELDDVTFGYPGSTVPVLDDVTLRIRPGELLAVVGENGAGKTSLVKLLLRFYDPTAGTVRIGGVDLRDADPADVRSRVGVLFQDYGTYELSARENVVLGRVDRDASDAEVTDALAAARALGVVRKLEQGLDSKVGRLFEGGHDLSGGEWQRLALARLIYRDADIWILDEPTSNLDPEAEAGIFAELRANLRDRIGIVISHRFSTVRIADRIVVMDAGRVLELGTHQELVAARGRYAHLFELQAAGYR